MAKKVKTPEEFQAAMEKKIAKRTLFFGTFRKALALFLGIAFTFAMVQIAFTKGAGTTATGGTGSDSTPKSTEQATVDLAGDESTVKEGETVKDEDGNDIVGLSKADAVKLLNTATAQAEKAGYDWSRKCYYTEDGALKVTLKGGLDATSTLNRAIGTVAPETSLDKVVGGFLDITGEGDPLAAKKVKGSAAAPEGMKDKFLIKAMSLTEGDIVDGGYVQTGNVYKFQLKTCDNPDKKGGNALSRATNDFVTHEEVKTDVANAISVISVESTEVQFSEIVIVAEIKDGKLTSLSLNYLMDVKNLSLKAVGVPINGTGKGRVEETYKNFVY